jgi:hypothetical protein
VGSHYLFSRRVEKMNVTLSDASPINPKREGQCIPRRSRLMNSLIQGENESDLARFQQRIRDLLQFGKSFNLPIVQSAVFHFSQGIQKGANQPPGAVVMNGALVGVIPNVGQDGEGPVRTAIEPYFVIENRGGLIRQEGRTGNISLQEFPKPRRVFQHFPQKLLSSVEESSSFRPFSLERLETFAKIFQVHGCIPLIAPIPTMQGRSGMGFP